MKKTSLSVLALLFTVIAFAQIKFEKTTFQEALDLAKKSGKLVFIDAYAEWCGPCKYMDKNIFSKPDVGDFYNKTFVNLKVDMEKGEGPTLSKKYNVRAYPSFLFVNSNGELVFKSVGGRNAKQFIELGQEAANTSNSLNARIEEFKNKPASGADAYRFFAKLDNDGIEVEKLVEEYIEEKLNDDQKVSKEFWPLFRNFVSNVNSPVFEYFVGKREAFAQLTEPDSTALVIDKVYSIGLGKILSEKNYEGYQNMLEQYKAFETPEYERNVARTAIQLAAQKEDKEGYNAALIYYAEKFLKDSPSDLNSLAWSIYSSEEDKELNLKSVEWAAQAYKLEPSYAITDTYAAVLYKNGKYSEAKKYAELAIEKAKTEKADAAETKALLKKINEAIKQKK